MISTSGWLLSPPASRTRTASTPRMAWVGRGEEGWEGVRKGEEGWEGVRRGEG